jgi:hypothetical protein
MPLWAWSSWVDPKRSGALTRQRPANKVVKSG